MILTAACLAFVVGVGVGVFLRDTYDKIRTRRGTMPSNLLSRSIAAATSSRRLGLTLVTLALLANAATGFLLITTRAQAGDDRDRVATLVSCLAVYNRDLGDALSERDSSIKGTADAEVGLWREYVRLFVLAQEADEAGDAKRLEELQVEFYDTVRGYVDDLERTQETRSENPYPDPDLCLEESRRE